MSMNPLDNPHATKSGGPIEPPSTLDKLEERDASTPGELALYVARDSARGRMHVPDISKSPIAFSVGLAARVRALEDDNVRLAQALLVALQRLEAVELEVFGPDDAPQAAE